MPIKNGLFTSEAVSCGHPDKLCDRISDAILDAFLQRDRHARVACETMAADGKIIVAGEFRTREKRHFDEVRDAATDIVRRTLRDIGYSNAELDIDPTSCEIEIRFNHQSPQIAAGVDQGEILGAGDQGLMFGYATDETPSLMPMPWALATDLIALGNELRSASNTPLKPDAKSQVTVRYAEGRPVGIEAIVLSWQHDAGWSSDDITQWLTVHVIDPVIPKSFRTPGFRTLINPAGVWTIGGPKGDTGLTGRKIIVDTYGGACAHGGGAFSGKDPSKVDRSAAYAARYVAKHVVRAKLAERCTVQLSYAIGKSTPVSVHVDLHGTSNYPDEVVAQAIDQVFDLSPARIIRELDLLRPMYEQTSSLGHFGAHRDPAIHKWEATPRVGELLETVATIQKGNANHAAQDLTRAFHQQLVTRLAHKCELRDGGNVPCHIRDILKIEIAELDIIRTAFESEVLNASAVDG